MDTFVPIADTFGATSQFIDSETDHSLIPVDGEYYGFGQGGFCTIS